MAWKALSAGAACLLLANAAQAQDALFDQNRPLRLADQGVFSIPGRYVKTEAGTIMVGPMSVGDGAYTAAGSVLSTDVPAGALASSRSRQFVREGWVAAHLPGTAAAQAKPGPPGSPSTAAGNYRPARG